MNAWFIIVICGAITYAMRASFIFFGDRFALPESIQSALRYVAPAAFAAITATSVLGDEGLSRLSPPDARVIALVFAVIATWRAKSIPLGLVIGMGGLWLLQWTGF